MRLLLHIFARWSLKFVTFRFLAIYYFAEHKFYSTYPKFQTDITSNSILQKEEIIRYPHKMSAFGFSGFPQKRPVKHHVFLDLFGSGSGTLRVLKSQTCPALSLLSRVFISGSRVLRNPVAHVKTNQCSFYLKMIFHAIDEKNHVIFTCCNFTNFLIQS